MKISNKKYRDLLALAMSADGKVPDHLSNKGEIDNRGTNNATNKNVALKQ